MKTDFVKVHEPERIFVLACEILHRELCRVAADCKRAADLKFLTQGLHDLGENGMRERLQAEIDAVDSQRYIAVALGFGLCNNGAAGLCARDIPLVIPRAHDCITLFLGSKELYREYFDSHSGTYFHTTGWRERDRVNLEPTKGVMSKLGLDLTYDELAAKYGESNARYMLEQLGGWTKNYGNLAFIKMGLCPDSEYSEYSRQEAGSMDWSFEEVKGNLGLLLRLVDGPWNENEFVVVPPGFSVRPSYDENIFALEPLQSE